MSDFSWCPDLDATPLLFRRLPEVRLTTKMAAKRFCDGNGRQDRNEELLVSIGITPVRTVSYRRGSVPINSSNIVSTTIDTIDRYLSSYLYCVYHN